MSFSNLLQDAMIPFNGDPKQSVDIALYDLHKKIWSTGYNLCTYDKIPDPEERYYYRVKLYVKGHIPSYSENCPPSDFFELIYGPFFNEYYFGGSGDRYTVYRSPVGILRQIPSYLQGEVIKRMQSIIDGKAQRILSTGSPLRVPYRGKF